LLGRMRRHGVKCSAPGSHGNGSRVDARLRAIVESSGVPAGEREEYVAFARALYLTVRRPPEPDHSIRLRNRYRNSPPGSKDTNVPTQSEVRHQWLECGSPDTGNSRRSRVVQRFLKRGLKGKLLMAIGREIEAWSLKPGVPK
jgi:hypothetical protein